MKRKDETTRTNKDGIKLSKQQVKATEKFNLLDASLSEKGYRAEKKTITIVKANVYAFLTSGPFAVLGVLLFFLIHRSGSFTLEPKSLMFYSLALFPAFLLLTLLHELTHGLVWSIFAKNHWKSISFGVIWEMLTPYCHCDEPLLLWQMCLGAFAPFVTVGLLPLLYALLTGNVFFLALSFFMMFGSGGDFTIILLVAKEKKNTLVVDHPSECGCVLYHGSSL